MTYKNLIKAFPSFPVHHLITPHLSGQSAQLDDTGIGQAFMLLTGLPPFLRLKELRAKDRGSLQLGISNGCNCGCWAFLLVVHLNGNSGCCVIMSFLVNFLALPRKVKMKEAMDRFELRNNGHKRMSEVDSDYVNLDPWMNGYLRF